jgi:hypothetical protein
MGSMPSRWLVLLAAAVVFTGCYRQRVEPIRPLTLRLRSSEPVQLNLIDAEGRPTSVTCGTVNALVRAQHLRGDTLFFSRLEGDRPSRVPSQARTVRTFVAEPACSFDEPGAIVLSAYPALKVQTAEPSRRRTVAAVIGSTIIAPGAVLVFAILIGNIGK